MIILFVPLNAFSGTLQSILDESQHHFGRSLNSNQDNYVLGFKYYLNQADNEIIIQKGNGFNAHFVQTSVLLGGGVKRWFLFTKRPAKSLSGIGVGGYIMTRNNNLDNSLFPLGIAMRVSW
jgi:hypothetical protein